MLSSSRKNKEYFLLKEEKIKGILKHQASALVEHFSDEKEKTQNNISH